MPDNFLYFAYGSNMLTKRICLTNTSATEKYIGCLSDHRLDFNMQSKRWNGAAATIVPEIGSEVWGVIYELNTDNIETLDEQEGVSEKFYFAKYVDVMTTCALNVQCRVYQQCEDLEIFIEPKLLPLERRPSLIYLNVILKGARDHKLPDKYIRFLQLFPDNGYSNKDDER